MSESVTTLLLYATPDTLHFQVRKGRVVASGKYGRLGTPRAFFEIQRAGEEPYSEAIGDADHRGALRRLVDYLQRNKHILALDDILAVVHRIPHGGRIFGSTVKLDHAAAAKLAGILHTHGSLPATHTTITAGLNQLPNAHHIGVVANGIYRDMPQAHRALAAAPELRAAFTASSGGEDGLAHEAAYLAAHDLLHAKRLLRAVSVHIGADVSVTALSHGKAYATSSGIGASAGIPGLHDAGALHPSVPLGIAERLDTETWRVAELLAERSGLAAMTGKSSYAQIEAGARAGDKTCIEALMILSYRIAFTAAGMSAAIGAPELLVFSGDGASWTIIEEVCRRTPSVRLLSGKARPNSVLSIPGSNPTVVWVEQTRDEALLRVAATHHSTAPARRPPVARGNAKKSRHSPISRRKKTSNTRKK